MSGLIVPGMEESQPNFQSEKEVAQWMNGKVTRHEVNAQVTRMSSAIQTAVNGEFVKIGQTLGQMIGMIRTQGIELEALVCVLEEAAPGFRDGYIKEFQKQSVHGRLLKGRSARRKAC